MGSGPSWQWSLSGPLPAESANSVPAARPHSALPPTHFTEWLGLPFPIQHKNYPQPFLGCPPRLQGLGSAVSDYGSRIPSSAQCEKHRAGAPESASPLPNHRNIPTHSGYPGPFLCQAVRHVMTPVPSLILKHSAGLVPIQIFQSLGNFPSQGQETLTTPWELQQQTAQSTAEHTVGT